MEATERFAHAVEQSHVDLAVAALAIAAHADEEVSIDGELEVLDELATSVGGDDLTAVLAHLFVELGFDGDREDYYDPRNSYLHEVLRRRRGIPITLSVVLIEVGRRCGVPLSGIGTPGHFMVRSDDDEDLFIDPFQRGLLLRREQMLARFGPALGADADRSLTPVGPVQILRRMLTNLTAVHRNRADRDALRWTCLLRTLLPDATVEDRKDLAVALASTGDFVHAAKILEAMVEEGSDVEPAWAIAEARRLRARLN